VTILLKMFTTQLTGLFKRIADKEEFSFEDGARLLAQAPVGDGTIYLFSTREMKAVEIEALESAEPLRFAKSLVDVNSLTEADRVLMFTRYATDAAALELAAQLRAMQIPFVTVSTFSDEEELGDIQINLALKQGLLPDDSGNRYGYPASMAALYVYYGLKFTIDEIFAEYEL
jgi:hypothetical protein